MRARVRSVCVFLPELSTAGYSSIFALVEGFLSCSFAVELKTAGTCSGDKSAPEQDQPRRAVGTMQRMVRGCRQNERVCRSSFCRDR